MLCFLNFSCKQNVKFEFEHHPKLTFNCILNPDSIIKADLSESRGIGSTSDFVLVENAEIKLFEEGKLLGTMKDLGKGEYNYFYQPKSGLNYKVEIYKDGYDYCEAITYVPELPKIECLKIPANRDIYSLDISIKIYDNPGKDYYWYSSFVIDPKTGEKRNSFLLDITTSPFFDDFNKYIESEARFGYWYLYMLRIVDEENDGTILHWKMERWKNPDISDYNQVLVVDEHYDKYLKSSIQMNMSENNQIAANEPVQIYSNISNGYGIFGANNVSIIRTY